MEAVDTIVKKNTGHRERLRARFVSGAEESYTDEALLELLLTYAIPQRDVQPLAKELITTFGSLSNVLSADMTTLSKQDGIKEYAAVLIKLIDWIRTSEIASQPTLFPEISPAEANASLPSNTSLRLYENTSVRSRSGLFVKAMLEEAITLLPQLPDSESLEVARDFLITHLHFSGQTTRVRGADYIIQRMFPTGYTDKALLTFARAYTGKQDLRDICFYRFCKFESLMFDIIENLLLPAIGAGQLKRSHLRDYLTHRFPTYAGIQDASRAVVEALVEGGITKADRLTLFFSYRDISLPALAFILHSEFPGPGMFDIGKIEQNRAIRAMLWKPDALMPALYELRNKTILSKISEIDSLRQFTTKYTLDQLSEIL